MSLGVTEHPEPADGLQRKLELAFPSCISPLSLQVQEQSHDWRCCCECANPSCQRCCVQQHFSFRDNIPAILQLLLPAGFTPGKGDKHAGAGLSSNAGHTISNQCWQPSIPLGTLGTCPGGQLGVHHCPQHQPTLAMSSQG